MRIVIFLGMSLALALVATAIMARANTLLFIGGTVAPVVAPPGVIDVAWTVDPADTTLVTAATLKFAAALSPVDTVAPFVCAQVLDSVSTILANACETLPLGLATGSPLTLLFDGTPASAAAITSVNVTVIQPVAPTINGSDGIEVRDVRWVLDTTDTSKVKTVTIVFAPFSGNNNNGFQAFVALQDSSGINLAELDTDLLGTPLVLSPTENTTLQWDLTVAPTVPLGPVSAEAITRFLISFVPKDPWDSLANVPDKVGHGAGMTTDGTLIYLLIGNGQDKLFRLDPGNGGWTERAGAPRKVTQGGALVYASDQDPIDDECTQGCLYAFRGGVKDDFWRYDIDANSWSSMADAPEKVKWGGALTWDSDDTIYAFRGGDTPDFWSYDIPSDTWATGPSDPPDALDTVNEGGSLVFAAGDVYALRGGDQVDFWRFDADGAKTWSTVPANFSVLVGRGGALASDGVDIIYALRGNDTKEIYRYQITNDIAGWIRGPDIPEQMREGGTLVFLGGDVYATQGRQTTEFLKISPLPPFVASAP